MGKFFRTNIKVIDGPTVVDDQFAFFDPVHNIKVRAQISSFSYLEF
jgi:hypothetical protein